MRTRQPQKQRNVRNHTADATLTPGSFEGFHFNVGALGAVVLTLPTPAAVKGMRASFMRVGAQALQLDPSVATDQFIKADGSSSAAGKYLECGADGTVIELTSNGSKYVVIGSRGTINEEA